MCFFHKEHIKISPLKQQRYALYAISSNKVSNKREIILKYYQIEFYLMSQHTSDS